MYSILIAKEVETIDFIFEGGFYESIHPKRSIVKEDSTENPKNCQQVNLQ